MEMLKYYFNFPNCWKNWKTVTDFRLLLPLVQTFSQSERDDDIQRSDWLTVENYSGLLVIGAGLVLNRHNGCTGEVHWCLADSPENTFQVEYSAAY